MKQFQHILKVVIFIYVIILPFAFLSCDNGDNNVGDPQTVTYTGVSENITFSLTITENVNRAVYLPQSGDSYQLTAAGKTSSGSVSSVSGSILTLTPSNSTKTFTATVSGNNIIIMSGTITWNDNTTSTAPSAFTFTGNADDIIPSAMHGSWLWERGQHGHTITMVIGGSTIASFVENDPDTTRNGMQIYTVTEVTKGSATADWTTFNVTVTGNNITTMTGTITWSDNTTSTAPSTFAFNEDADDIIPNAMHGTWLWERGEHGHTITMVVGGSTIASFVENDPDATKNGMQIYTVTEVTKGSTTAGWTTFNVTVTGMGTLPFDLNTAGTQFRDNNGLPKDAFPRIYNKQLK